MKVFNTKEEWEAFHNDTNTELVDDTLDSSDEDFQFWSEVYKNENTYISVPYERCLYLRRNRYDWMRAVRVYPKQVVRTIYTEEP